LLFGWGIYGKGIKSNFQSLTPILSPKSAKESNHILSPGEYSEVVTIYHTTTPA
jgi:hypothetical protein